MKVFFFSKLGDVVYLNSHGFEDLLKTDNALKYSYNFSFFPCELSIAKDNLFLNKQRMKSKDSQN